MFYRLRGKIRWFRTCENSFGYKLLVMLGIATSPTLFLYTTDWDKIYGKRLTRIKITNNKIRYK